MVHGRLSAISKACAEQLLCPLVLFTIFGFVSVLTISGTIGTQMDMNVLERMLYFGVVVLLPTVVGLALKICIDHVWPDLKPWKVAVAVSIGLTVVFAPILWQFLHASTSHWRDNITPVELMFVNAFYVSMIVLLSGFFLRAQLHNRTRPRLFKRFENTNVKQVNRVSVRNHYVDVFTDCGMETLLMRFGDAVDELEGISGEKVHRSHWVSYDAMERLETEGGKVFLLLTDGSKVPVSRSNRSQIERRLA